MNLNCKNCIFLIGVQEIKIQVTSGIFHSIPRYMFQAILFSSVMGTFASVDLSSFNCYYCTSITV